MLWLLFKAARLLDSGQVRGLVHTVEAFQQLKQFMFIKDALILALVDELPHYLAVCDGVCSTVKLVEWWKSHIVDLPNFVAVVRLVLHVVPSSAAAERVFSMYNNSFRESQGSALADIEETTLMLQYNERGSRGQYGQVLYADRPVHVGGEGEFSFDDDLE